MLERILDEVQSLTREERRQLREFLELESDASLPPRPAGLHLESNVELEQAPLSTDRRYVSPNASIPPSEFHLTPLPRLLLELRLRRALSIRSAAAEADVCKGIIVRWEHGASTPRVRMLERYAHALGAHAQAGDPDLRAMAEEVRRRAGELRSNERRKAPKRPPSANPTSASANLSPAARELLRLRIEVCNLSRRQFGIALGAVLARAQAVSQSSIYAWETGRRDVDNYIARRIYPQNPHDIPQMLERWAEEWKSGRVGALKKLADEAKGRRLSWRGGRATN